MIMEDPYKIEIRGDVYSKLERLSEKLGVKISKLIDIAFDEFFELVCYETEVFLEKIGLIESLKNVIKE